MSVEYDYFIFAEKKVKMMFTWDEIHVFSLVFESFRHYLTNSISQNPQSKTTVSGLIIAGYSVLIAGFMLKPSKPAAEVAAPVVAKVSTGSTAIPSVDDEAFATFIEDESNLQKWIDTSEE